jgi:integrase
MKKTINLISLTDEERATWPHDHDRQANWLLVPYSSTVWRMSGKNGRIAEIDFNIAVAGGGRLPNHESLYRTAKEFAYWWREHPESRVDNATSQALDVQEFLALSCALTHRSIWSFAEISRSDFSRIERDWLNGTEGLLAPSIKVRDFLAGFASIEQIPQNLLARTKTRGFVTTLKREQVMAACGLTITRTEQTRWEMDQFCLRVGLPVSRAYTEHRPQLRKTTNAVHEKRMGFLKTLYAYRAFMRADVLSFQPTTKGIGKGSAKKGKQTQKTKIVPSSLMFKLLSFSGERVAEHHEQARTISYFYERGIKEVDVPPRLEARSHQSLYVASAYLVIAALTVRRPDELRRLRRDCLQGDAESGYYIHVYIVKNLNAWIALPVPPLVAETIKALLKISVGKDSDPLFRYYDVQLKRYVNLQINAQLNALADVAGAVEYSGLNGPVQRWTWMGRHTRRYMSSLYFWGYGGSIEVVQHILRHTNVGSARAYTDFDPELANMWSDDAARFTRHIARAIAFSEERFSGPMGDHLTKLGHKLQERFQSILLIEPERLVDYLEEIIRRKLLVLVPNGWVICTCPASRNGAQKALCRKQPGEGTAREIGPDFSKARATVCPNCFWAMMTEHNRRFAQKEKRHLELAVASPHRVGTVFGGFEKANLATFVQIDAKHSIETSEASTIDLRPAL